MEEQPRPQERRNLYYIFRQDQAEHPMPEEKMLEILKLIQILLFESKGAYS